MAVDHNNPQSRDEEILIAMIDGEEYDKIPQSRMEELLLELKEVIEEGGGGTSDYTKLQNLPTINNVTLTGDMTAADLNLVLAEVGKGLSTNDYSNEEKAKVASLLTSIQSILDGTDIDSFGDVEIALLDKADISDLGTAAAKDSTNAVTSGSTDLVESGAVKEAIDAAVSSAYHHAGTKTVAQLTHDLLVAANEGNVYNITDSGTTTSDFIEGIGKTIDEGSNVGICKVGDVYMFDLLSGFVDTTNFVQKSQTSGLLKNDGTVNDEIEGDVSTLKSGFTNLDNEVNGDATVYPYADVITIEDAIPANLADCSVKIEPVQDLHGYDHPWVGGAGKNKLPLVLADIKANNTTGTWNGNVYSINDGTITVNTDSDGNVVSINANGTFSAVISFILWTKAGTPYPFESTSYTMNGCRGGSGSTYKQDVFYRKSGVDNVLLTALNGDATADFSVLNDETVSVVATRIVIYAGTLTNQMFYPMLRLATETDATFAPYTNYCPITGHTEAVIYKHNQNWWDEDWESGDINTTTGQPGPNSNFIRSKNYNSILPNTKYYGKKGQSGQLVVYYYDVNKNYIDFALPSNSDFTTPDNCAFFKIRLSGNTYNGDVCINVFNEAINGTYFKYAGKTYTIALGDTIYGGTVDFDSGVMMVDRVIVDLGQYDYSVTDIDNQYFTTISPRYKAPTSLSVKPNWICDSYDIGLPTYTNSRALSNYTIGCFGDFSQNNIVFVRDPRCSSAAEMKTALNGVQLVYKLATPITIQLTPQQIQLLKGTNTLTASTGQISVTVNGVSGSIGAVQTQANDTDAALAELVEQLPTAPTTDGAYVLTVTVADGTPTYSWESAT